MALINNDVILNSNPTKRLRIAYENMKSDYNESSVQAHTETYKNQPLAFIIENSRYIFSEPTEGLKFYTESVINSDHAFLFTEYENEKEKIESYLTEFGNKMGEEQRKMYNDLLSLVTEKYNNTINTSFIISHACKDESVKSEYDTLVESVYRLNNRPENFEKITSFMESTNSADLFFAVSPYLMKFNPSEIDFSIASNMNRFFNECTIEDSNINEEQWKHYVESVVIVSKLYNDDIYKESVSSMRRLNSIIFEGLASESIKHQIDELFIEHVTESVGNNKFNTNTTFDAYYSTPYNAVNRIFEDDDTYSIMKEENEKFKMERTKLHDIAMNVLFEYVTHEYQTCNDVNSSITGYNYFNKDVTIESAFTELSSSEFIIKESADNEEVSDDEVSNMEKETSDDSDPKKAKAPKADDLATKVQNKAMDKEAKFLKNKAENQQKGQKIKNAIKAVGAIPDNIIKDIKQTAHAFDEMDDERRKQYIIKPGYRKKVFRNLKLALMYGATASVNLSMVPVLAIARHFSKQKDARIRNELARELDTNIKVCEEKISDAAADGNKEDKYHLMRLKSQLEKEALRVKSNSRYI